MACHDDIIAIRGSLLGGQFYGSGSLLFSRLRAMAEGKELTPRQCEVIVYYSTGLTRAEVGSMLGISERTVEDHLADARERTGAGNTLECVLRAIARGDVCIEANTGRLFVPTIDFEDELVP
jgi:DNA-binding NarL/FixJ family response regulator